MPKREDFTTGAEELAKAVETDVDSPESLGKKTQILQLAKVNPIESVIRSQAGVSKKMLDRWLEVDEDFSRKFALAQEEAISIPLTLLYAEIQSKPTEKNVQAFYKLLPTAQKYGFNVKEESQDAAPATIINLMDFNTGSKRQVEFKNGEIKET